MRLHVNCQELFSFATHRQVLTPTRILQGTADAVMYFTYAVAKIFEEKMYKGLILWVDDLLIYGESVEEVFALTKWVLKTASEAGLKFNPKKLEMLTDEVIWCGKLITPHGIAVDPKRKRALSEMPEPGNGAELMQFIHAANWIRTSIPNFSGIFGKLQDWLNGLLKNGNERVVERRGFDWYGIPS